MYLIILCIYPCVRKNNFLQTKKVISQLNKGYQLKIYSKILFNFETLVTGCHHHLNVLEVLINKVKHGKLNKWHEDYFGDRRIMDFLKDSLCFFVFCEFSLIITEELYNKITVSESKHSFVMKTLSFQKRKRNSIQTI